MSTYHNYDDRPAAAGGGFGFGFSTDLNTSKDSLPSGRRPKANTINQKKASKKEKASNPKILIADQDEEIIAKKREIEAKKRELKLKERGTFLKKGQNKKYDPKEAIA